MDHYLTDIFSDTDLDRLRAGKRLNPNKETDDIVAAWLVDKDEDGEYEHGEWQMALAHWFNQASVHGTTVSDAYKKRLRSCVGNREQFFQTVGELMSACFLEEQLGFDLVYLEHANTQERRRIPDFRLSKARVDVVAEVKTSIGGVSGPIFGAVPSRIPRVRKALQQVRGKFRTEDINIVLIVDFWRPPIDHHTVFDAMYGKLSARCWIGPNGPVGDWQPVRQGDRSCTDDCNTRVGAVGVLSWRGGVESGGYFIHNAHAEPPVPPHILDPLPQLVPNEDGSKLVGRNWPR